MTVSTSIDEFTMLETGWKPTSGSDAAFAAQGAALQADLRALTAASPVIINLAGTAEEVAAILEGRFELRSEDDFYTLSAGQAVLIPPGAPRNWHLVSPRGTLYRVWKQVNAA
jgi:hypothetical protein